ncbi:MAG: hypothetical protein KJ645_12640 [Planctomycetes bacterium]|nr:hypothetical protein [Planctomycetota bacterium]
MILRNLFIHTIVLFGVLISSTALLSVNGLCQEGEGGYEEGRYPNTNAKDLDGDMPWRVENADTAVPVLWIIKDADQWLVEVDEMKYVVLYDVSDGYDPPGNWDNPLSDHVVYFHSFNDMEIAQDYWYWLAMEFENDGSWHGTQPNGTPLTPANLGYTEGETISFTLRLYGKDGVWPFYTDVKLDQDFKVHVGETLLPTLPDWYWGDVHNHGWKTDNLYEYADPTEAKALAAAAMGLSFVTITDHASDLDSSDWNALGTECALYSTSAMRLIRAEEIHANQGGFLDVRHMLGYDLSTYIEGDEDGTYSIQQILNGPSPSNHLGAQGGFAYAAHPTDPSLGWTYGEMETALAYETFVGLEFFNERNAFLSWPDGGEEDDEYHPWGGKDSIDPATRDWTVAQIGWDNDLLQGLSHWDHLMSDRLDPVRKVFLSGGSDAHGNWNYRVYRTDSLDLHATSSAMGKVRTAVYLPSGLTDQGILDSLRHGRTVVSDGPAVIFGLDGNNDGSLHGPLDAILGEGPVKVAINDQTARFVFLWSSSLEYGDVVCIRLFRGNRTTGESPDLVWENYPRSFGGDLQGPLVSDLLPAQGETVYFRAEAYTFDPAGPPPTSGDVSNFTYNTELYDYNYRCFTNPIWIKAGSPLFVHPVRYQHPYKAILPFAAPSLSGK